MLQTNIILLSIELYILLFTIRKLYIYIYKILCIYKFSFELSNEKVKNINIMLCLFLFIFYFFVKKRFYFIATNNYNLSYLQLPTIIIIQFRLIKYMINPFPISSTHLLGQKCFLILHSCLIWSITVSVLGV